VAAGAYWRCPICLRRVPDKIAECYCGRIRQPGDGPDETDLRTPHSFVPIALGAAALAAVAGFAWWATRSSPPVAVSRKASSAHDGSDAATSRSVRDLSEASSTPAPTTTTLPGAARAYDFALRHVQLRLASLSARLDQFDRTCGPGSRHSSCDAARDQIAQEARDIRESFDAAEAKAREAFLDGGLLMELRQRNAVAEGDVSATLSRAQAASGGR
jgi:hypothetical protein